MIASRVGDARKRVAQALAAAVFAAGLAGLTGCSPEPSTTAANTEAPASSGSDALMGAPEPAPTASAPAPVAEAPPPAETPWPSSGVLAMSPIPNPPEGPPSAGRVHGRYYAYDDHAAGSEGPAPDVVSVPETMTEPGRAAKGAQPKTAAAGAPGASARPATPSPVANPAGLQTALAAALLRGAVFKAPDRFPVGKAVEVSLVVPASFFDALKTSAETDGLADAATTAALSARLVGRAFTVNRVGAQSLPLAAGRDSTFRWTVTALSDAAGPLKANVSVALLGEGARTLDLGTVTAPAPQSGSSGLHVLGGALLLAIAALAAAWISQAWRRGRPAPTRNK